MTARRGLLWPLLLIVVGLLFLLANFGYIAPFSIVALLRLWPLILIVIGIDIAIGRRWPLAALGLDVVVLAAGLALVASQPASFAPFFVGSRADGAGTSMVSAPRGDEKSLTLHLNGGAGTFRISGGASDLVNATSDQENLQLRTTGSGDRRDVRIDQSERGFRIGGTAPVHVDVKVASTVPTSVDLNAGAGEFIVDTSLIQLTDARLNVGAASLTLILPQHPSGDVPVTVSAGASSVVIEIPAGVEARVTTNGALVSLRSENPRVASTETSGYAGAKDRLTIRISAGATSVVIR